MTLRSLPWLFGGYALFGTAAVITLLIVALTGVGVAMNARAYGVQRLQGMTLRQAWALDARAASSPSRSWRRSTCTTPCTS